MNASSAHTNSKRLFVLISIGILAFTLIASAMISSPAAAANQSQSLPTPVELTGTPKPPTLFCGVKFNDLNANGVRDSGEPGLPDWTINLFYSNGMLVSATTTNANGHYCVGSMSTDDQLYSLSEVQQTGWIQTAPGSGSYWVTPGGVDQYNFGNTYIGVSDGRYSFGVKFVCGNQRSSELYASQVVQSIYATEVNILNDNLSGAEIQKRFVVLVGKEGPGGREPHKIYGKELDNISLDGQSQTTNATMDDCYRIAELVYGQTFPTLQDMPLTIGFLQLLSNQNLTVDAVYTSMSGEGSDRPSVTFDVERVQGKKLIQ